MSYTLGFHPKPRMTFSPALPLGWGSRGEILDVHLDESVDPGRLVERLNAAAPEGIRFLAATGLRAGDVSVSRLTRAADYSVAVEGGDPAVLRARLEGLRNGSPAAIPLGKAAREAAVPRGALIAAGIDEGALRLRLRLDTTPLLRPDDVARFLRASPCPPQRVERLALWHVVAGGQESVSPLDLERVRSLGSRR